MPRHTSRLIIVALVLFAAGAAAANSLLAGGSPGLIVNGSVVNGSTVAQASPPATTSPNPSTNGVSGTPATTGSTTSGVPATTTPTPGTTATSAMTIDEIVSITRVIDAGAAAASVLAVPAGRRLIVTDVVITNAGTAPACGASISSGGTATPATTTIASAAALESGTGLLCVPAQTSLNLGLTTGLEFAAGQSVVLASIATSPLHYHLRGFLVSPGA
jgi:hypothetical protein